MLFPENSTPFPDYKRFDTEFYADKSQKFRTYEISAFFTFPCIFGTGIFSKSANAL
jgi:hypothetical protein